MSAIFKNIKKVALSVDDVKNIVKEYVQNDTGRPVKDVEIKLANRLVGSYNNEHYEPIIDSITVVFSD